MKGRYCRWVVILLLALSSGTARAHSGGSSKALTSCADFPSHAEVGEALGGFETSHPEIARNLTVGTTVEGREIWGLLVSADPDVESAEPEILVVGATHGDECISVPTVLDLIDWLLSGYGDDPFATELIDGAELVFVPLLNADGYSSEPADRFNANGIDLNRNYGFAHVGGESGTEPFCEPETSAMRALVEASNFTLGLTYHTVADFISGPWNYNPHSLPVDEELFAAMNAAYVGDSGYLAGPGYHIHDPVNGDQNDWLLGTRGTLDWTVELRSDTEPEPDVHRAGFAAFTEFVFTGVTGLITDAETEEPLLARIEIEPEGVPAFTDPDVGDFHRPLLPGTYDITVFSQGYEAQTVSGVEVLADETTELEIGLLLPAAGSNGHAFAVNEMAVPFAVTHEKVYENETWAWYALGPPDGVFYSIGDGGCITVDMGEAALVTDVEGVDFQVISGTGSDDPAEVFVADDQDGSFVEAASGSGDLGVDLADSGFDEIRYVLVCSSGGELSEFYGPEPGYDLDAVVNLSAAAGDADSDSDSDSDADADAGAALTGARGGGCGCSQLGRGAGSLLASLLKSI